LVSGKDARINVVSSYIKEKNFKEMRKWVAENEDIDSSVVFRYIYDNVYKYLDTSAIPQAVIILGDYQFKAAFVADKQLNLAACLTELMGVS